MPLVPVLTALIVAIAYFALGALSGALSHIETAAWTVWLASGLVFGLLLACDKRRWPAILWARSSAPRCSTGRCRGR